MVHLVQQQAARDQWAGGTPSSFLSRNQEKEASCRLVAYSQTLSDFLLSIASIGFRRPDVLCHIMYERYDFIGFGG